MRVFICGGGAGAQTALARGKSPDQIAEELEEDLETIYRLIKEVEEPVPCGV